MKKLLIITCFIFIASCSSNSFTYLQKPTPIVKNQTHYCVSNVDVKFVEGKAKKLEGNAISFKRGQYSGYPNEKEMASIIKEIINQDLKDLNIYSGNKNNSLNISLEIEYERLLNDTFSNLSYHNFAMSHKAQILKDGKVVAESNSKDYTVKRFPFELLIRASSGNNGPQNEVKDLNKVLKGLVKEIYNLGN
ncbi:YajG family lipoprotein [Rickettsiales bacterium]|nr:YajG family lipoprotein [Rickettsiales bacterium]